jgi:hypothetical protein
MRWLVRPVGQRPGAPRKGRRCRSGSRVVGVERRHDQLADLALGDRIAGARAHDLDDHTLVDDQALARFGLVGHQAEVGGAVARVAVDAAGREPVAQRHGKRFAAERGLLQRGQGDAGFVGLLEQDAQEARRADIGVGPEVGHRLQLQLGLASAAGKDGAADRHRTAVIIAPAAVK